MVYRVYSEKKPGLSPEAGQLLHECRDFLHIPALQDLRLFHRYDVEGISPALFEKARLTVFSEPPVDMVYDHLPTELSAPHCHVFAVEPLPGQFDQRADSAAQCIQLLSQLDRPLIRTATVYALFGELSEADLQRIQAYVINPVENRLSALEKPETLSRTAPPPAPVPIVDGFIHMDAAALATLADTLSLAMDQGDLAFLQAYFRDEEGRDPTLTEIRVVDTYWSDHCRHTTFSTHLDAVTIEDPAVSASLQRYRALREEVGRADRPETLMDLATIGARVLARRGQLPALDASEEINACSIHMPAVVNGETRDYLLMFKNETHNHPTEIEPFGGAATCIGGCIRDPLSGRAYVHQALRVTGGGDPRVPLSETLPGKLPQRKLAQTAAAGFSSYGNQIGLATGHVAEIYHEGYVAKRLECGAVVAAAPAENVVRARPRPGDVVLLLGGRTGRDGIGGATGSSKSHDQKSLQTMASEVQKGNAPEERKIQRLFRDASVTRLIRRCNDFGAGGVAVAIGELADGLDIDLDAVRRKYEGLDGTELAISESQERMAVVVAPEDQEAFIRAAQAENLEAYPVAVVTASPRMVMRWQGQTVADLSRAFLNTNGAPRHARVHVPAYADAPRARPRTLREIASSLESGSRQGLTERFDSTIGAGTLLMPFGGVRQRSPSQAMAALLPVLPDEHTSTGSVMAYALDPTRMEENPYLGAYETVLLSCAKLVAAGAERSKIYLSFQEFFEKLREDPDRWGKPFAALLGALDAQMALSVAAIGGKDSMSGSFLDRDVPPTFISFAIAPIAAEALLTTDFNAPDHPVALWTGRDPAAVFDAFFAHRQHVCAAWAVEHSVAEGLMQMSFGNRVGFASSDNEIDWYGPCPGCILSELDIDPQALALPDTVQVQVLGHTTAEPVLRLGDDCAEIAELEQINDAVLADVYPIRTGDPVPAVPVLTAPSAPAVQAPQVARTAAPLALIPVFPGTNCEYDTQRAVLEAGGQAEILVVQNLCREDVERSVERFAKALQKASMVILPGGFSGGDEPEGSAKFITAFFRNPAIRGETEALLQDRGGLMLGICNGFQALIKLGLVPYGRILDQDVDSPTLTFNCIGRHQSSLTRTRIVSNRSPWLQGTQPGEIYTVPISHGEGRFICPDALLQTLIENGQVATQYVDLDGKPSLDTRYNPNGSQLAIEAITSPDGRVLGKMGHTERTGPLLYRNVPGRYDMQLFRSAIAYF